MKNSILENATTHFRNKISGEMKMIEVPEWDCKIWFKTSNTLSEEGKVMRLAQEGKTIEALVETLIMKSRNEDGTKLFRPADKSVFMNEVDPTVLIRVVGEMNALVDEYDVETATKN